MHVSSTNVLSKSHLKEPSTSCRCVFEYFLVYFKMFVSPELHIILVSHYQLIAIINHCFLD